MLARLRSATVALALLALIASLGTSLPASAEDNSPAAPAAAADSDHDGVLDAATTAAAVSAAAEAGKPVEDLSQRTETTSVTANANGTFTSKEFAAPVRIKQDGDWVDVDNTLTKQADGSWAPKASPVDVTIDGGTAKEAARVTFDDGQSLAVTWPTNLPEPTINGGVATYKLSAATDLLVAVSASGVNTRIRLNQQPAADDPVFTLGLRADGVDVDQTNTGGLVVTGDDGKTVAKTTSLVAWDATTDAAGDPANVVDLDANLDQTSTSGDVTQHTLDLTTPDGFLTDPTTRYPVTIDPDISMAKTRDTWVRSGDTASHASDYRLIVGKIDPSATSNPGPTRSYLKFYNGTIEDNPDIDVVSAELGLWQYYGYSCTDRSMYAYPVGTVWPNAGDITWDNKPPVVGGYSTHVDTNRGATGCGAGWTTLDVTNIANAWASGDVDMQGIRLTAGDEDYSSYERRFCSMDTLSGTDCNTAARTPYLSVTYSVPPNTPSGVTVATGSGQPPRISATISDPDGGMVTPHVTIKDGSGTVIDEDAPPVTSGTLWSYTSPPLYDGTFTVTVKASDGGLSSASSTPQSFTVVAADQGVERVVSEAEEEHFVTTVMSFGTDLQTAKRGVWDAALADQLPYEAEDDTSDPDESDVVEDPTDPEADDVGSVPNDDPQDQPLDTSSTPNITSEMMVTPQSATDGICPTGYRLFRASMSKKVKTWSHIYVAKVTYKYRWCGRWYQPYRISSFATNFDVHITQAGKGFGWEDNTNGKPAHHDGWWYTWGGHSHAGRYATRTVKVDYCPPAFVHLKCYATFIVFKAKLHADGSALGYSFIDS